MDQAEVHPTYGISFLYPGSTDHLIQSNSEKMLDCLRALLKDKDAQGMCPIRILISTDDLPPDTIKFQENTQIDSMMQNFFSANLQVEMSIAEVYSALLVLSENLSGIGDLRRADAAEPFA
jgi:hypothetical protein